MNYIPTIFPRGFAAICVIQYLSLRSFSCLFISNKGLYIPQSKSVPIKWGILNIMQICTFFHALFHTFCICKHNRNRRNYIFLHRAHKNFFILLKWCVNVYERILRQKLKMSVKLLFVTVYTKNSRENHSRNLTI